MHIIELTKSQLTNSFYHHIDTRRLDCLSCFHFFRLQFHLTVAKVVTIIIIIWVGILTQYSNGVFRFVYYFNVVIILSRVWMI